MVDYFTEEERRVLSKPIGDLTPEEYAILKAVFIRRGLTPPIIVRMEHD